MHADIVLGQEVLDYAPLFVEIADAYFEREMFAEARPIYELLGTDESVCILFVLAVFTLFIFAQTSSLYILLQTAACLRMLDELKEAAEVYEAGRLDLITYIFPFIHPLQSGPQILHITSRR